MGGDSRKRIEKSDTDTHIVREKNEQNDTISSPQKNIFETLNPQKIGRRIGAYRPILKSTDYIGRYNRKIESISEDRSMRPLLFLHVIWSSLSSIRHVFDENYSWYFYNYY